MQKKRRNSDEKTTFNRNSIGFTLLDSAFDGFIRRVLWPETGLSRLSDNDRIQLANVFVSLMEMTEETLIQGAISDEIRDILQGAANEIDVMGRRIAAYNRESATDNADDSGDNSEE